jgi:hypothetical protein
MLLEAKKMKKIVKYCVVCKDGFAENQYFCPKDKTRLQFFDLEYSKQSLEYSRQKFALLREQIAFAIASICLLGLTGTSVYFNANADFFSNVSKISFTFFTNLMSFAFFGFVTNSPSITKAVASAIANLSLKQEVKKDETQSNKENESIFKP